VVESAPGASGTLFSPMASGNAEFFRDFAAPFVELVGPAFSAAGMVESSEDVIFESFPAAPRPRTKVPLNDLNTEFIVGVAVYFAAKLPDAALDAALADLYENRVKPAVARFWSSATSRMRKNAVVRFDHWIDESGVLLRIEFRPKDEGQAAPDLDLVLEAVRRAEEHILELGLTHRVMTYSVVDGELEAKVRLSEPI
jgi:hypothetical protein